MQDNIVVNGVEYVRKDKLKPQEIELSDLVLIRTYSAGVHFGKLSEHKGTEVTLHNARRLWSWAGACSLSQVAMDGVDLAESRISMIVPKIILTEVIEITPMSQKASENLMSAEEWKK